MTSYYDRMCSSNFNKRKLKNWHVSKEVAGAEAEEVKTNNLNELDSKMV